MSKLHRRGYLAISTIAAASALFVGAPAGASAATEEPGSNSTPGGTAVEPSGSSTQPAATEWAPQGADKGASSGGAAPLEHGSSVGSGVVNGKPEPTGSTGSDSEPPSYAPDSGGSYEPEPSVPATVEEPVGAPRAESGIQSVQPAATGTETAPAVKDGDAADDVAVGGSIPLEHSTAPRGGDISSVPAAPVASFTNSGDRVSTGSYALMLLFIIALGLVLTFAGARLKRRRQRRQLEAFWREQDVAWEAALRRVELREVPETPEPSPEPLHRVNAA